MILEDDVLAFRRVVGAVLILLSVFVMVVLVVDSYEPERVQQVTTTTVVTSTTVVTVTPATASVPVPAVIKEERE